MLATYKNFNSKLVASMINVPAVLVAKLNLEKWKKKLLNKSEKLV